jgi:hypothetical protein
MDEAVRRAMAKWPDVPAVFGWLALDARGRWLIRGERIGNPLLIEFIGRNYACDDAGRWFFQNGPQRVFVALAYAPWVLHAGSGEALTHTGAPVRSVRGAWMDREGIVVLETEYGAGIVDDRDVEILTPRFVAADGTKPDEERIIELLERTQAGEETGLGLVHAGTTLPLLPIRREDVPARLGYVSEPTPLPGEQGVS